MITEFDRFELEVPAALAVSLAKLRWDRALPSLERALEACPDLADDLDALDLDDIIATLRATHIIHEGNNEGGHLLRLRLLYLACGRIYHRLIMVRDSQAFSRASVAELRRAYAELLEKIV